MKKAAIFQPHKINKLRKSPLLLAAHSWGQQTFIYQLVAIRKL